MGCVPTALVEPVLLLINDKAAHSAAFVFSGPGDVRPSGSNLGSQFRSGDYQDYLAANGLLCSMSALGHCGDNAACEGFFGLIKRERIYCTTYQHSMPPSPMCSNTSNDETIRGCGGELPGKTRSLQPFPDRP